MSNGTESAWQTTRRFGHITTHRREGPRWFPGAGRKDVAGRGARVHCSPPAGLAVPTRPAAREQESTVVRTAGSGAQTLTRLPPIWAPRLQTGVTVLGSLRSPEVSAGLASCLAHCTCSNSIRVGGQCQPLGFSDQPERPGTCGADSGRKGRGEGRVVGVGAPGRKASRAPAAWSGLLHGTCKGPVGGGAGNPKL